MGRALIEAKLLELAACQIGTLSLQQQALETTANDLLDQPAVSGALHEMRKLGGVKMGMAHGLLQLGSKISPPHATIDV